MEEGEEECRREFSVVEEGIPRVDGAVMDHREADTVRGVVMDLRQEGAMEVLIEVE